MGQQANDSKPRRSATISVSQLRVPEKARALLRKATAFLKADKPAEARKQVDAALAVAPDYPDGLAVRALMKVTDENDPDSALEDLDRATRLDPNLINAYFAYGVVLNRMHRVDDAMRRLERCVQIQSTAWPCELELGKSWLSKGDPAMALQHANRAASLGAAVKEPEALALVRGYAYIELGKYQAGTAELNKYLLARPNTNAAHAARATLARLTARSADQQPSAPTAEQSQPDSN